MVGADCSISLPSRAALSVCATLNSLFGRYSLSWGSLGTELFNHSLEAVNVQWKACKFWWNILSHYKSSINFRRCFVYCLSKTRRSTLQKCLQSWRPFCISCVPLTFAGLKGMLLMENIPFSLHLGPADFSLPNFPHHTADFPTLLHWSWFGGFATVLLQTSALS